MIKDVLSKSQQGINSDIVGELITFAMGASAIKASGVVFGFAKEMARDFWSKDSPRNRKSK